MNSLARNTLVIFLVAAGTCSYSEAQSNAGNLSTKDRQQIMDLIYSYSYNFDSKNLNAFLNLYTQDAIWEDYYAGESSPTDVLDTPEKLRQAFGYQMQQLASAGVQSRHFLTNLAVSGTNRHRAQGTAMFLVAHQKYDQPQDTASVTHTGEYRYKFVKTSTGWKFRKIEAHLDHSK